jgi:GAF domain-containing protein
MQKRNKAEKETKRYLADLEAVNRISTALRISHSLDEMLPSLLQETLAVLDCQSGAIWLYEPDTDELRQSVAAGFFERMTDKPLSPGVGIGGMVFKSNQPYQTREFASDPQTAEYVREQFPQGWGGVCIPVRTSQETVGVLYASVQQPRQFTETEIRLLATMAEIAGAALHRMSLYSQTERRLERISALHMIDNAISATPDLRIVLEILLGQVRSQLHVDASSMLLLDQNSMQLEYAASQGFLGHTWKDFHMDLDQGIAGEAVRRRHIVSQSYPALSGSNDHFLRYRLMEEEGFSVYYGTPLIAKGKVIGVLEVFHRAPLNPDNEWLDFLETLGGQAAIAIDNALLLESLQRSNDQLALAYDTTLEGWSRALELRDRETQGHTERMVDMALDLARSAGVADEELVNIRRGTLLHDIGKMGIPDEILLKPGPLTEQEWRIMRLHPVFAYKLLAPIDYLRPVLDIPYCHHERWDGSGYPQGLREEEIPLAARLFSMIDVYDALLHDRPYRPAWPLEKVLSYIRSQSGKQFDPQLIPLFLKMVTGVRT